MILSVYVLWLLLLLYIIEENKVYKLLEGFELW